MNTFVDLLCFVVVLINYYYFLFEKDGVFTILEEVKTFTLCDLSLSIKLKLSLLRAVFFLGRGLTIVGSILEGDFKERTEDVALAKEVRGRFRYWLISECLELIL